MAQLHSACVLLMLQRSIRAYNVIVVIVCSAVYFVLRVTQPRHQHGAHTGCVEGPPPEGVRVTTFHALLTFSTIHLQSKWPQSSSRVSEYTNPSPPNEILLEIFDSFRQSLQRERRYENIWNSNKGWFKLAHVCREWRQVVLTSPSRLHVRLLVTIFRSGRSIAIRRLPPLPIIVDHKPRTGYWHVKVQHRLISGPLAKPNRS